MNSQHHAFLKELKKKQSFVLTSLRKIYNKP